MGFENLTDEQKAKAQACKTPEEILALARDEGYELSDEELDSVVGGAGWFDFLSGEKCTDNVMKQMRYLG